MELGIFDFVNLFHEVFGPAAALPFPVFRTEDARRFRILFSFRTIPLWTAHILVFCFHSISFLSIGYSGFILIRPFTAIPFRVFRLLRPQLTSAESAPPSMYSDGSRSLRYFCGSPRVSTTTFVPSTCAIYTHAIRAVLDFCLYCGFILA